MTGTALSTFYQSSFERGKHPFAVEWFTRFQEVCAAGGSDFSKRFSFEPLRCDGNANPIKVKVTRGSYGTVVEKIVCSKERLFSIVGPTGCGKSTFALLELCLGSLVLIVCPTEANAANIVAEFTERIPAIVSSNRLGKWVPKVCFADFFTMVDYSASLLVTTTKRYMEFVAVTGIIPPADYTVLDEYHLRNESMSIARAFLHHAVPVCHGTTLGKIVLVSATPPDEPPPPPRMSGLTITERELPDPLTLPTPPCYLRSGWPDFGNRNLLIVVDSCASGHELSTRLNALGEESYCMCIHSSFEEAVLVFTRKTHDYTLVVTPDAEAGITFSASYMTNPGLSVTIRYQDGVVFAAVTALAPDASNQRLGRAGRDRHTLVLNSVLTQEPDELSTSPVILASAYLHLKAFFDITSPYPEVAAAGQRFTRLTQVNRAAAIKACAGETPLLQMYRADNYGDLYREFGGGSSLFTKQNAADFRFFTWPGGSTFAPFVDLTSNHDPTNGMTTELQKSMADEMANSHPELAAALDLTRAADEAKKHPDLFALPIWIAIKDFEGKPNARVDANQQLSAEEAARRADDLITPAALFGETGAPFWQVLLSQGATVSCKLDSVEPHPSEPGKFRHLLGRMLHYRGETINYNNGKYLTSNKLDPKKIAMHLLEALRPVMVVDAVRLSDTLSVDLSRFSHHSSRSENPWFRAIFPPVV